MGVIRYMLVLGAVALLCTAHQGAPSGASQAPYLWNVGQGGNTTFNITAVVPNIAGAVRDSAVVLLTTYFGALPCVTCKPDGTWCNGGVPQLANMSYHEAQMQKHLDARTAPDFAGHIVVDYESWRGTWNGTNEAYRNASLAVARQQYPTLDAAALEHAAARDYSTAAVGFLAATLRFVRKARPAAAGVGLYGYPDGSYYALDAASAHNDLQMPVFEASSALYPSLYLPYKSGVDMPFARNAQYVDGNLNETARVNARLTRPRAVLPYTWYRYHDGEPSGLQLLTEQDTHLQFTRPLGGAAGAVRQLIIWGSEKLPACLAEAAAYFRNHAPDFAAPGDTRAYRGQQRRALSCAALAAPAAPAATTAPPVDPNGPVPAWTPCSL